MSHSASLWGIIVENIVIFILIGIVILKLASQVR